MKNEIQIETVKEVEEETDWILSNGLRNCQNRYFSIFGKIKKKNS
jgi:hypothetical protein